MQDQNDKTKVFMLVVFESEEQARAPNAIASALRPMCGIGPGITSMRARSPVSCPW
jgi:hypothetical protein